MKFILFALSIFAISGSGFATELSGRIELIKYSIKLEKTLPLNLDESPEYSINFNLINKAYAYREGETCLILGFKSKFQKGMCRLSKAEGAQALQKECSSTQYACNPQVFGERDDSKPFCISKSVRRDLSKACALENIKYINKKKPSQHLAEVLGNSTLAKFDIEKLDVAKLSQETLDQFKSTFKNQQEAIQFTQGLCEDLKQSEKLGHQPFDSKTCDNQLKLLVSAFEDKKPVSKPTLEKIEKNAIVLTPEIKAEKDCISCETKKILPVAENIKKEVETISQITHKSDAQAYFSCIQEIEKHPEIKKQIDHINQWKEEYSRKTGYWHELDGEKNFGLLCDPFHSSKEEFVFVNQNGFKIVSNIKDEISGAETVSQFKSGKTDYYIVQDLMGNYFELFPKNKLSSSSEDARSDVAKYHKRGGKQSGALKDVEPSQLDFAKACIKDRLHDYLDWMTYKENPMPSTAQYNADISVYNSGERESLKAKYSQPVDEYLKTRFSDIMKPMPACNGILTEKEFETIFRDLQESKISLYERMRGILGLKN